MPTTSFTKVGWNVFTVPARVTSVTVGLDGAGSGSRPGGRVTGKLAVKPGWKLYCHVGEAGKPNAGSTAGSRTSGAGSPGGTGRSQDGGDSGGGYSAIRIGSTTGSIVAVAGGAGGDSGDGGPGGAGGGTTGGSGGRGNAGPNATGAATGGTQVQGGNGGTSSAGAVFNGANATDGLVAAAGYGATAPTTVGRSHGGGGGGGGLRSGGGGQASSVGYAPGGGGGGGSSYTGGLSGATNVQGAAGVGNGSISVTWVTPPPGNIPPVPPSDPKVNSVAFSSGMLTKATTSARITATLFDVDKTSVRMLIRWSTVSSFATYKQAYTGWAAYHADGRAATGTMTGLAQNTHYYVRLYAQDPKGLYSTSYTSIDFWTNKAPLPPTNLTVNTQGSGMTLQALQSATFSWLHNDEDAADYQSGFALHYRKAATPGAPAGAWTGVTQYVGQNLSPKVAGPPSSSKNEWVFNPGTFRGNTFYEWQVRTRDQQYLWGEWSDVFTFYSASTTTPPTLISPVNDTPVDVGEEATFTWRFIDPDPGDQQGRADVRYRVVGATKDVTSGTPTTPSEWVAPPAGGPTLVRSLRGLTGQDFTVSTDGTWFTNSNSGGTYPVEDNTVRRLNANGTVRDSMVVQGIGHGMPMRAETVSGTTYIILAYYHRPAPSYFEKFVRLPYVPGKTYTLSEALALQTTQWPGTAFPEVPPATNPAALQGFNYDGNLVFKLYDDTGQTPGDATKTANGICRIDVIQSNVLVESLFFPDCGYNPDGTVILGRRESEGLQVVTVGGKKYLYWGVVAGLGTSAIYNIYSIPLPTVTTAGTTTFLTWEDEFTTGTNQFLTVPADYLVPGYTYEWQVRTYDRIGGLPSEWSDPRRFIAIATPGSAAEPLPISAVTVPQGSLGCGVYRAFIYEQGGRRRLGEVDPIETLKFSRLRDDISQATAVSTGFSVDCGAFYGQIHTWVHELVVFRDGVRVWEGPITRLSYTADGLEIEAKDVMAYLYRRILRQGYNDAYRLVKKGVGGKPDEYLGLLSVVKRASMLVAQGLASHDPNVLPYLTAITFPDDARESRVVTDWSRSAWEEIDDLAATAGLDYTTVGRRIILWDTHRAIGRLPELRDGDFSDSPIVTEYGMQLANFFAVTNGSGIAGFAVAKGGIQGYGPVEQLASSYNDSAAASGDALTPAAMAAAQSSMTEQAQRNIAGRWPAPLVVRIPDNTTMSPKAGVGFQQLIPGVWLPLRSTRTPREVMQWQKLDSVSVEVEKGDEKVKVVFSPAPNGGNDPDAEPTEVEA